MRLHRLCLLCLLLFCLLTSCVRRVGDVRPDNVSADVGTVLVVSDLHFNPFHDPSLLPELVASQAHEWSRIFETSKINGSGAYDENLAYPLLASGLDAMREVASKPDFVLVPGDFLVHHFARKYHHLRHESGLEFNEGEEEEAFRNFAQKTMRFLAHEIQQRFPKTMIVPVLGNNDSVCGNYRFEPSSLFLRDLATSWSELFPNRKNRQRFLNTFSDLGHYALEAPQSDLRLIVLNTVVWSRLYKNMCGDMGDDPADESFRWLESQLADAERDGQRLWLIFHIPPGIDTFETLKVAKEEGGDVQPIYFWREEHHHRFVELVGRYSGNLRSTIAAHIHRNSFQLLGHRGRDAGESAAYVRLIPALSPVYGNNPAFKTFRYDRRDGHLLDYDVHHLDLTSPDAEWQQEHSFSKVYGHPRIDVESLQAIYYEMLDDPRKMLETFSRHHKASSPVVEIDRENWPVYWIAIGHLEAASFRRWHQKLSEEQAEDLGN